jgi:LPS export ABC transporter permease LptG/LPS export ABC transporter permease LptF
VRIFTRYILKEVLSHGLIGIAVFTFVIFMRDVGQLLELVVRNSAPIPSIAEFSFLLLPKALTVTIPMAVLVGILIGLSRMSADSEITAMRASGVGVQRFVWIIALFGVTAWILAMGNSILLAPRSAAALARLQNNLASTIASANVQPRVFYEDFKNTVIYVQDVKSDPEGGEIWRHVFQADISTPGSPKITIAQEALVSTAEKDAIRLHLINGEEHLADVKTSDQYSISTFQETDIRLNLPPIPKPAQDVIPVAQLGTRDLLRQTYHPNKEFARWYWIEFNRRLALPTACLVLVLIGIPLGLSSKKGGRGAGFVLTIVLVFIYYFIFLTGIQLARSGKLPAVLGVWLANIIFALIGLLLLWRVDKMPMEIGLSRALGTDLRNWIQKHLTARNGDRPTVLRRRFLSTRFPLILDDYVLRSFVGFLGLILASFLVLVLIFTFFELLSDIMRNRIPLVTVGEYLLNKMPDLLYTITPLAVLLAVLVTFGLMQKSNEITAMKATGISIYRTTVPVLVICAFLAGGLFLLEESYLPYANTRVETLRNFIKGKPAQTYQRPGHKWIFGQNNVIYYYEFYDPDRDQFGNISSFEFDPHTFQITKRIYAARAHWEESLQKWVFERGWERSFQRRVSGDHSGSDKPFEQISRFDVSTFPELSEQPSYFKKEIKQSSEMNYEELRAYIRDLQQSGFDVVRLRVQLQKKLAFPLITLVMAVLAIPFSLSAGKRGALTGVAAALLIGVVYWIISGLFEAMGNVNQLPAILAAWSPDIIFGMVGAYLVLKTPS